MGIFSKMRDIFLWTFVGATFGVACLRMKFANEFQNFSKNSNCRLSGDCAQHAFYSKRNADIWGAKTARFLGHIHEMVSDILHPSGTNPTDSWRDEWNNEVGIYMSQYLKEEEGKQSCFHEIFCAALENRLLIKNNQNILIDLNKNPKDAFYQYIQELKKNEAPLFHREQNIDPEQYYTNKQLSALPLQSGVRL